MSKDETRNRRERLRASALNHTMAELGHELSTPLNVLLGRLSLLDEADDLAEAKSHGAAMRRQVDKLLAALEAARTTLPEPTVEPMAVERLAERLAGGAVREIGMHATPATRVAADLEEAALAVLALCDHLGGEVSIAIETRHLDTSPSRHLAPGEYVCVVVTKDETAAEPTSEAVWALSGARGHARRTQAAIITPSASEAALVLTSSG